MPCPVFVPATGKPESPQRPRHAAPRGARNPRVALARPARLRRAESCGHAHERDATPLANAGPTGYQPSQLAQAYGFNQISDNGSGTTIAIVDAYDDPNIVNDLKAFNTQFSLPQLTASTSPGAGGVPTITVMNQTGGVTSQTGGTSSPPPTDQTGGWETEEALDVEWAHAMAPGANIVLVEANSSSNSDLFTAVQAANTLGANVVSMSWGGSEFSGESSYDSVFHDPRGGLCECLRRFRRAGGLPGRLARRRGRRRDHPQSQ